MEPEFDLIDRVARAMTDADPAGDFRVRVMARLPVPRPQPWWHLAAIAFGGVAIGMLIMVGRPAFAPAPARTGASGSMTNPGRPAVSIGQSGGAIRSGGASPASVGDTLAPSHPGPLAPLRPGTLAPLTLGPDGPFPLVVISPIQPLELSIAPIVVGPLMTTTPVNVGQKK